MLDPVIGEDCTQYLEDQPPDFLGPKIAITGATGMLGSYLVEFCLQIAAMTGVGASVLAFARQVSPEFARLQATFSSQLKVVEYQDLSSTLKFFRPDTVIHAASPAAPENFALQSDLVETNIRMTDTILNAVSDFDSHVIFFSSGEVYGSHPALPTAEDDYGPLDHLGPRGAYPASKRAGEFLLSADANPSVRKSVVRIYHTYGPGVRLGESRIFSTVLRDLVNEPTISLRGDGVARRSFLYSLDLARALPFLRRHSGFDVFNVAGSEELSILEFAEIASQLAESELPIQTRKGGRKLGVQDSPIPRGLASTDKLRALGWYPTVSVSDGLSRTLRSALWRQKIQ